MPAISGDGRLVAFYSSASNLVPDDTNLTGDIFVHDRDTGITTRVSVASGGAQANDESWYPAISGDGRYVAFISNASNLVPDDTNLVQDIFVHDINTGSTTRVSVATSGAQATGASWYPSITTEGRYVAFSSYASNLVTGDANGFQDIFVHDRTTGSTTRVNVTGDGTEADADSQNAAISANGRFVAFASGASTLVAGAASGFWDIFVKDRDTGATTRVSVSTSGLLENESSGWPALSADGRYVAFHSIANNLVTGDTNFTSDIFVHDRDTAATTRVSLTSGGVQGNNGSAYAALSADGHIVAFESAATDLVTGDTNGSIDVFVYASAAPAPTLTDAVPGQGPAPGGTDVTLTGTGFVPGATVTFGGTPATAAAVVDATTITATTPAHAAGAVDVVVTNPDTSHATLTGGFTFVPCTFTIDPASTTPGAPGGPGSVAVMASASVCGWTAVSNDSWMTVSPASASGTGNGTVNYTVAANAVNASRGGTVTIGGKTLSVQQAAANAVPGAPIGLGGSSSGSSLSLSWSAPSMGGYPTSYTVEAGSGPGLTNLANVSTGNTLTTFSVSGVAFRLYFLRIRATNASGSSATSNEIQVRVGPAPPNAPTGLSAGATGSSITLSWTAPVGAGVPTAYIIEAGSATGLSDLGNFSTGNTGVSYSTSGVANGRYVLRVRATNPGGTSGPSNEVLLVVGPAAPGAPTGLTWSSAGSSISLSWTAPGSGGPAAAYIIEAGSSSGLANLANFSTGTSATSYSAGGIANGTYFVRVNASNTGGTSGPSNEVALRVGCTSAPVAPGSLHTNSNSGGTVQFGWTAPNYSGTSNGPTSYVLEAGSGPGLSNLAVMDLGSAATSFTASGIAPGTYYVRVKAKNLCGTGSASNEFQLIVP